jgi:transcriptional regulator with XRE-family HTH domain
VSYNLRPEEISEFLKEKRAEIGPSLRVASKRSGVSHTHIRDIEDGRSAPSFKMVMKFLKSYRVDIDEFLRETGYLSPNVKPEIVKEVHCIPVISWTQAGQWQEMSDTFRSSD